MTPQAHDTPSELRVAGPYGRRVSGAFSDSSVASANSLLVVSRFAPTDPSRVADFRSAVLRWAESTKLGQQHSAELRTAVAARRAEALSRLAGRGAGSSGEAVRLPFEWRMLTGAGEQRGLLEVGIALHGTYGWPIVPASGLKGLVRHWARTHEVEEAQLARILGDAADDRDDTGSAGTVTLLDGLPADVQPVDVARDVVTPHYPGYYEHHLNVADTAHGAGGRSAAPPSGWENPVPIEFLTTTSRGGAFVVGVVGPRADIETVISWLTSALDDFGFGAKTSSGYGYAQLDGSTG